jgi:thioredoxin-related protein
MVHNAATEAQQEQVRWNQYSQTLLLTAHYAKRPAIIYFHSEACPACDEMESKTLSNRSIIHLINTEYLPIKISDSEDQFFDVAARFGLVKDGTMMVPAVIILSSTNIPKELARMSGYVDPISFKVVLDTSSTVDTLMRVEADLDRLLEGIINPQKAP